MEKECITCKHEKLFDDREPCKSCRTNSNWQPARKKRKKRKELKAELSDWKREFNYEQARACKAEEKLAVASDEIESMQRALADKDAIIDELRKEVEENPVMLNVALDNRWFDIQQELTAMRAERDYALAVCTEFEDEKQEIIDRLHANWWVQ